MLQCSSYKNKAFKVHRTPQIHNAPVRNPLDIKASRTHGGKFHAFLTSSLNRCHPARPLYLRRNNHQHRLDKSLVQMAWIVETKTLILPEIKPR
jgi:hypothetical protein